MSPSISQELVHGFSRSFVLYVWVNLTSKDRKRSCDKVMYDLLSSSRQHGKADMQS